MRWSNTHNGSCLAALRDGVNVHNGSNPIMQEGSGARLQLEAKRKKSGSKPAFGILGLDLAATRTE